jgi:hypothetical protein
MFGESNAARRPRAGRHLCRLKASLFVNTRITAVSCPHNYRCKLSTRGGCQQTDLTSVSEINLGNGTNFIAEPKFGSHYIIFCLYIRLFSRASCRLEFLFSSLLHSWKRLSCNLSSAEQFVAVWALRFRVQNGFICSVKDMIETIK